MIKKLFYLLGLLLGLYVFFTIISYKNIWIGNVENFINNRKSKISKPKPKESKESNKKRKTVKDDEEKDNKDLQDLKKVVVKPKVANKRIGDIVNKNKETFENMSSSNITILKNKSLRILISVYNNNLKDLEWLSEIVKPSEPTLLFTTNKKILISTFSMNPYVKGAILNNVSLKGPNASTMSIQKDKSIVNFTAMFMVKINDFKKNFNYLFEIKCKSSQEYNKKTDEKNYIDSLIYIAFKDNKTNLTDSKDCKNNEKCKELQTKIRNSINIHDSYFFYNKNKTNENKKLIENCMKDEACSQKLPFIENQIEFFNQLNTTKYYNIEINVGTETFYVYNITDKLFETDLTFIGLSLNGNNLSFFINNSEYTFTLIKKRVMIADSVPITINDNGNINMILYSFAYYDSFLNSQEMNVFKMYNYYYLFGSNQINQEKEKFISFNKELKNRIENNL